MTFIAIDHIQLAMPAGEEDAARRFYRDLLGLTEMPKPAALAARGGCWFEQGNVKVHLGVEPDFRPARKAHSGLLVVDLSGLVQKLQEAGFTIARDEPVPGYDRCHVADPFGNRIEFMQLL
jgi:catechol 2,3-dioxygenase-like lactoylglutathione lyase family enzyme